MCDEIFFHHPDPNLTFTWLSPNIKQYLSLTKRIKVRATTLCLFKMDACQYEYSATVDYKSSYLFFLGGNSFKKLFSVASHIYS